MYFPPYLVCNNCGLKRTQIIFLIFIFSAVGKSANWPSLRAVCSIGPWARHWHYPRMQLLQEPELDQASRATWKAD